MLAYTLWVCALAQIQINAPTALVAAFNSTDGQVIGSTSTFGAPTYGERVIGRLIFRTPIGNPSQPHCTSASYTGFEEFEAKRKQRMNANAATESGALPQEKKIFLVRRGGCTFVQKVRVAEELGADAVIVADNSSSPLTRETIHTVIMADDGSGAKIVIPSILISYQDGQILEKAVQQEKDHEVILTLSWDVPINDIVIMDLWMSSSSKAANDFLLKFSPFAERLSYKLQFVPHYHIYDLPHDAYSFCLRDNTFCADDPDSSGPFTGKDVVEEDLRQLCLWHATAENNPDSSEVRLNAEKPSERQVRRSMKFWEYVGKYFSECQMIGSKPRDERFGTVECSEKLMRSLSINVDKVRDCVLNEGTLILANERNNVAWSSFALRINGWRFAGQIEFNLVARAICIGYKETPEACQFDHQEWIFASSPTSGMSFGSILAIIASVCLLLGFLLYCYHARFFSFYVRRALQEEVMLEVQSQMAEYKVLGEDDDEDPRELRPKRLGRLPRWA